MIPAIIETERVLPILRKYVNYAKSFVVQNLRRQIENISEIIKVTLTCVFDDFNSNVIVQKYISSIESELSELFSYNDMETYFLDNGKEEGGEMAYEDVKDELMTALKEEKQQAAYQSKVNQLKILYPVDKF